MKRLILLALTTTALLTAAGTLALAADAAPSTLPTISVAITPTTIVVTGALQSGAVNVVTHDTGVKEASVILFQLKPGATFEEVEAAISKAHGDTNATGRFGSIVFNGEATPGQTGEAQIDLLPGQYVAVLPGEEGKGSRAHELFTVAAAASPAVLPAPEATIRSIEFGFRGPNTLHDGELVRFENEGYLVHMDVAAPVKSMASARRTIKLLLAGREKQVGKLIVGPPASFAGPLSSGAFMQETITAKPGIYVEVCFMDTQDGRSHSVLGMERIIKIVK